MLFSIHILGAYTYRIDQHNIATKCAIHFCQSNSGGVRGACEGRVEALGVSGLAVESFHYFVMPYWRETPRCAQNSSVDVHINSCIFFDSGKIQF